MIAFFGKHEIISQWQEVLQGEKGFVFCEDYQTLFNYSPKTTTVVYVRIPSQASLKIALKLKSRGYRVCKFWAGTDSRYFNDAKWWEKQLAKWVYRLCLVKNLSPAPWLSKTLEKNGLKVNYWPSCSPIFLQKEQLNKADILTLQAQRNSAILIYSNADRHWIYNTEMMLELAEQLVDTSFIFVGDDSLNVEHLPNVTSLGRIPTDKLFDLYRTSKCLVRITSHDGYSRMIIEAMYFGLPVITNWPVPHAYQCHTLDEIKQALQKDLPFNQQGYDYVRAEFNLDKWKNILLTLAEEEI